MQLQSIKINDILSIKEIELSFQDSGLFLLEGYNYDRQTANGAGKSSIFNALCFCLYGKMPKNISVDDYVRHKQKMGSVTVKFTDKGDSFEVTRQRPAKLVISKNDVIVNMSQEELETIIGLNYNQFLVTMYTSQTYDKKLITMNDTEKKDFFLNLMKLDDFVAYKKKVDLHIKTLNKILENQNIEKTKFETRIETLSESLLDEKDLSDQIATIDLNSIQEKIDLLHEISAPDLSKYVQIEQQIAEKLTNINKSLKQNEILAAKIEQINDTIDDLKNQTIEHDIECPHCHEFIYSNNGELVSKESLLQKRDDKILALIQKRDTFDSQFVDEEELINKKQQISDLQVKIAKKKQEEQQSYYDASSQLIKLNKEFSEKQQQKNTLIQKLKQQHKILQDIKINKDSLTGILKDIETTQKDIVIDENLSVVLSMTGAPAYVMDAIINQFNESVNKYLQKIWEGTTYQLFPFKSNNKGESIAKFSERFCIDGQERSIGSLSGGEYRALSIVMDMSIIDLVQNFFNIKINPIILDEPFQGLDSASKELVIKILTPLAKECAIIVVDHESEFKSHFCDTIKVEKCNGITKLG